MRDKNRNIYETRPRWKANYSLAVVTVLVVLLLSFSEAFSYNRRTPVVEAVAKAGPAVVNIRTEQITKRSSSPFFGFADPFFEEFFKDFGPQQVYKTQALGSGVVVDPKGYILTNAHVIEKASKVFVAFPDAAKEIEAKIVGKNERIDLAILKISGDKPFPYLAPSKTEGLLVGETVIAIGNPLGLGHSVTTGVVSAPQRRIALDDGMYAIFIQTDALINPGNSGGPLLNINGELIGINTAIARQAQGIGFAIPIDIINRIMPDLIKYGKTREAYSGIIPAPVGKSFHTDEGAGGVLVKEVEENSPAAKAGIKFGDVILSLDGTEVTTPAEFLSLLESYTPGKHVRLKMIRGFETQEIAITLAELPADYGMRYSKRMFGFTVEDSEKGVTVKHVDGGSPAQKVGILPGDVVAEVAGESPATVDDYTRIITTNIGRVPLRFLIFRGNRGYYIDLP